MNLDQTYNIQDEGSSDEDRVTDVVDEAHVDEVPSTSEPIDSELKASFWGKFAFYMKQALQDSGRNKCNFCLGFCAITTVVLSLLVINTMINQGPIIFISVAQQSEGQVDAFMIPSVTKTKPGDESDWLFYLRD